MIVNSSQIRMDASSGHKDVSKTSNGKTVSRNHAGRNEEYFTLNLPDLSSTFTKQDTTSFNGTIQSTSRINTDGSEPKWLATEHVISKAIDELTGTKIHINDTPENTQGKGQQETVPSQKIAKRFYHIGGQQFSMLFTRHKVQTEYEAMSFNSEGEVITADGRTIQFSLNVSLERTSIIHESILGRAAAGYFIDPLVLHFDNGLEALSEQSFLFDINSDGRQNSIPGLRQGSGFLALDLDGDGTITSGRELFGPTSGSGFSDLSVHDSDENLWIDENDPIFSKLQVWMNASSGKQQLLSLKEAGVGAISLSSADSMFNLKTPSNTLLGQVAASGIFLTEDGAVKSLQDYNFNIAPEKEDTAESVTNLDNNQLLASLRSIIAAQQNQLELLARHQRLRSSRSHSPENIMSKFWQWQEKYNTHQPG